PLSTEKIPQLPPSQPPIPNLEEFSEPLIPSKSPSNNEPPQLPSVSTLLKKPYESSLAYWLESGKDNSNLLTGLSLRQALRWSEQNQIDSQEQEFLSASIKLENQIEEKKLEEKNALNKLAPTYTTFKQLFNNNLMFLPIIIPVLIMLGSLMFWFRSKPALNDQQKTSDTGTGLGDINVSNNKKPILNQNLSENTVSDTNQLPQSNNSIGKTLKNSNIPSNASIPLTETRKINVSKIENQFLVQSSSVNPRLQRSSLTSLQPINTLNRIHLRSVSFSPGGKIVASSSWDKRVKLWDVATGRELKTFIGHQSPVRVVIFSPDGKTLASGSADRSVKLWDVSTGRELETFRGFQSHVLNVSFSRNGKTLVSGSADRKIKFWDILVGREFNTFKWHRGSVLSVRFSPDGQTIASGSTDRSVKSWDMATGRELKTINGHQGTVLNVSFSPDGKTLVSGSTDKSIELWDVSTGQELRAFNGHQDAVYSVSFSPDGKTLVSG
ncbi:MAG: WD40 repeat domain-containing protein, partial [Cyanobacteria bacterium WB6_1B_304]|nr:WD40 repeat domain-containing protein [Cyanobacteria bacterium WB6_1B_304]